MMRRMAIRAVLVALALTAGTTAATAQVFGTFTWQMQPYCNRVTLTLTTVPGNFRLDGADDQCGAAKKASASGIGVFNPDGTVGLNFTIVTSPGARPIAVSASVSPANGQGTWTDSVGNSGTFAFFGAVSGLPARPLPASGIAPAVITNIELANGTITGANVATGTLTGANVAAGSLTAAHMADGPRVVAISGDNQNIQLSTANTIVRSLTISAPAAGNVIVNASGYFAFESSAAGVEYGRCSITTSNVVEFGHLIIASDGGSTNPSFYSSFGSTRVFDVPTGPFTVNLVCTGGPTASPQGWIQRSSLNATFIAQ